MNFDESSKGHQDSQGSGAYVGWLKEVGMFRLKKRKVMGDPVTFFNCLWEDIEKTWSDSS